jgi:hypothetical protein
MLYKLCYGKAPCYIAECKQDRVVVLYDRFNNNVWYKRENPYEGLPWTHWQQADAEWSRKRIYKKELFVELL